MSILDKFNDKSILYRVHLSPILDKINKNFSINKNIQTIDDFLELFLEFISNDNIKEFIKIYLQHDFIVLHNPEIYYNTNTNKPLKPYNIIIKSGKNISILTLTVILEIFIQIL